MTDAIKAIRKGRPAAPAQSTHQAIQEIVAREQRDIARIVKENRNFHLDTPLVLVNVVCTVELSVTPYPPEPGASKKRKISIDFGDMIGPPGTTNPPDTPFIFRLFGPTCTIIAYPTGKLVVTGCSNPSETAIAVWYFIAYMQTKGYRARALGIQPQNFVFTSDVRFPIDLVKMYKYTQATSIHQMDSFPGVRYKMGMSSNGRNNIVVTAFSSGKYIMAGCANHTDAYAYGKVLIGVLNLCRAVVPKGLGDPDTDATDEFRKMTQIRREAKRQRTERGDVLLIEEAAADELADPKAKPPAAEEEDDEDDSWLNNM